LKAWLFINNCWLGMTNYLAVDQGAVFQSEKSIRGEPVESCELRCFKSFEFF